MHSFRFVKHAIMVIYVDSNDDDGYLCFISWHMSASSNDHCIGPKRIAGARMLKKQNIDHVRLIV